MFSPRIMDAMSPTGTFRRGLNSLLPTSPEKDAPPVIWSRKEREPEIMLKRSPEHNFEECDVLSIDQLAVKRVKYMIKKNRGRSERQSVFYNRGKSQDKTTGKLDLVIGDKTHSVSKVLQSKNNKLVDENVQKNNRYFSLGANNSLK